MKRIILFIIAVVFSVVSFAKKPINTKNVTNFPSTSYNINITSDVQYYNFSGTKTLSAPYSIGVTGSPVNGSCIFLSYDGSGITTGGNAVTVLGMALSGTTTGKAGTALANQKYLFLGVYNSATSAWVVRYVRDATVYNWITRADLNTNIVDDSTLQVTTNGIRIKPLGINSAQISATAAIPFTKMEALTVSTVPYVNSSGFIESSAVTPTELGRLSGVTGDIQTQINARPASGAIVSSDIAAGAAIPYSKLSLTGGVVNADIAAGAAIALSKIAATTASKALVSDGSGVISPSAVTATEVGYLSGVTSNIQDQIDNIDVNVVTYMKITSNTTLTSSSMKSFVLIDGVSGGWDITLPAASSVANGRTVSFYLYGSNNAIIKTYSGDIINTSLVAIPVIQTDTLKTTHRELQLISDGTGSWYIGRNN